MLCMRMASPQKPPKLGLDCEKDDDTEGGLEICTFTCDKGFNTFFILSIYSKYVKHLNIKN